MAVDQNEYSAHILVVDDDKRIRKLLQKYLQDNGYRASTAQDAAQARAKIAALTYDLLVLDIMMPDLSGLEFTKELRQNGNSIPILLLTARAEIEQRIEGLSMGGDDYLAKPFDPQELLLRINNILRRAQSVPESNIAPPSQVKFGEFVFFYERGELKYSGKRITLTMRESTLLRHLTRVPGRIVKRSDLCDDDNITERAIDVQVNRLRRKIEIDPRDPTYLQTIRGQGYILRVD